MGRLRVGNYRISIHSPLPPRHHHLLNLANRLGGIEALRARLRAVHDGVAAV